MMTQPAGARARPADQAARAGGVRRGPAGEPVDTPRHRALSSTNRVAILRLVRTADTGLTAGDVAEHTGLHLSTTRAHLERLAAAGLLERQRDGGGVPGRPAWRYRSAAPDPAPAPYRALAAALLTHLAGDGPDTGHAAARAGQAWGTRLAAEATAASDDPVTAVTRVFDTLGFDPKAAPAVDAGAGDVVDIRLHTCPFLELIADHGDTMCGLHGGVARGVLRARGAADTTVELLPFAAPDACVLRLRLGARGR